MADAGEVAAFSWDEGLRRLESDPALAPARHGIVAAVHDELRRRVGHDFSRDDLARAYGEAGDWYLDLASRVAPRLPAAWEPAVTLDAAFALYGRRARDTRQ